MFYCLWFWFFVCGVRFGDNADILVISPSLSRGNQVWNIALALGLSRRGYNVSVMAPFIPEVIKTNSKKDELNYIILEGALEKFKPQKKTSFLYDFVPDLDEIKLVARNNWDRAQQICEFYLTTEAFLSFLSVSSHLTFEVILWDLENSECLYPLIHTLKSPPVIILSPQGFQPMLNWIFGTHWKPYLPLPGLPYDKDMDFLRRFMNAITIKFMYYQKYEVYLGQNIEAWRKTFRSDFTLEDALKVEEKFSLALVNTNFDMDYARDTPPSFILVGDLHTDILQVEDLEFKENDHKDIVYVSLQDDKFDVKQLQGIADCLGSMKDFRVFWRVADGEVSGKIIKPKNIIFNETFNQIQILGNKQTKLFITSGSLLSLQEGLHFGVPLLAVPSTYAQINHVKKLPIATAAQGAIKEKYLCDKVHGILNDQDYLDNTRINSVKFNDKPTKALNKAIFWVEYITRHKDSTHLDVATRRMNYFTSENIDILCFALVLIVCVPLLVLHQCLMCLRRRGLSTGAESETVLLKVKQD